MRTPVACAAAASLFLASCALRPALKPVEKVWEGSIAVRGIELVPKGTTLRIRPGTRVRFDFIDQDGDGLGDAGLRVEGKLLALGTDEAPIVFEGAGTALPGRWGEIRLESGEPSVFRNCMFSGAQWALHAHFTSLRVEASLFRDNTGGMKFRGDRVRIYGNFFTGNGTAIRYWESSPEIIANIIRENGTGVFARLGSAATLVRNNNFVANLDYHIKLGELQAIDIDARFNYWGGLEGDALERMIFDRLDVPYLGRVVYEPLEAEPFALEDEAEGARTGNSREAGW